MPKKLMAHPNERVDLSDFVRAATDYTSESLAFGVKRSLLDRRARVLDGFRVEVADQVANPGQITVFNGTAFDRDGKLLNNEDQVNVGKTITLSGASTTFYIEVEFTESETDTDARAFWDPTFDQTSPIPDGQEFSINATTRLSPDWQIVTPVSTTGFDAVTDPNSNLIPLMVLVTNPSNVVDTALPGTGFTQVFASTVLEADLASGVGTCRVLDARLFPDTGTINIDVGDPSVEGPFTITSVDRTNGVIIFAGGPTASAHNAGGIVRVASGVARLVPERTTGSESLTAPTQPDVAQRIYQADEFRGSALATSKSTFGNRSDLQLRSLKDQVDYLSSQLRELKFGSMRPDVTSQAAPASFPTAPRHFDSAGGVQGARGNATATIGDGTATFGDFNGTDETPFVAAIAHLAAQGGGTIYVKRGTYVIGTTITITDTINFVGEDKENTIIQQDIPLGSALPAFAITLGGADDNNKVGFENFTFTLGAGAYYIGLLLETVTLVLKHVDFGVDLLIGLTGGSGVLSRILADYCLFQPVTFGNAAVIADFASSYEEILTNSVFRNCTYLDVGGLTGFVVCTTNNTQFLGCNFTGGVIFSNLVSTLAHSDIAIRDCQATLATGLFSSSSDVSRLTIDGCSLTLTTVGAATGLVDCAGNATNIQITNNFIDADFTGTSVGAPGAFFQFDGGGNNISIHNNYCLGNSGQAIDHVSLTGGTYDTVSITNNEFRRFHRGVYIASTSTVRNIAIRDNRFDGDSQTIEQHGVLVEDGYHFGIIDNNRFENIDGGAFLKRGITLMSPTGGCTFNITNNFILAGAGGDPGADLTAGIFVNATGGVECNVTLRGNIISFIYGLVSTYGIYVNCGGLSVFNRVVISDNIFTGSVRGAGGAGTQVDGIHVENVNNVIITGNSFIEGITTTGNGDAACIHLDDAESAIVTDNECSTPIIGGTPTNYQAGIAATGALRHVRICGNVIKEVTGTSADEGIHIDATAIEALQVDSNTILWGNDMENGVVVEASTSIEGISVCGNHIYGISGTGTQAGIAFFITSTPFARGIRICANVIVETSWLATNSGIRILSNPSAEAEGVQVNNNVIRGDLSGSGTRSGTAINLDECEVFQCNNNMCDWNDAGIQGRSIWINDCSHGAVNGNVVRPGTAGTTADIDESGTSDHNIIDGNIVGSNGLLGIGAVDTVGGSTLIGVDDISTAVTNKAN